MLHCKFTQCVCTGHTGVGHSLYVYVTRPMKIDHLSTKNRQFVACLLYHNLITIYTTATNLHHYCRFYWAFFCSFWKWDSVFGTKDINETITPYNLCSHG